MDLVELTDLEKAAKLPEVSKDDMAWDNDDVLN